MGFLNWQKTKYKRAVIVLLFIGIAGCFFYKSIFLGFIPFPGDLLIAEYNPWKTYTYLGYNPGSYPNKGQYFDTIRQIYPWKTFSIEEIKKGNLPLWNPYNFSGAPLLANVQSAIFYPLSIFYFVMPQQVAWTLLIILQPLLAGLFTYIYARKIKFLATPSIFAGIAFSYSLFMSTFLEYNTVGQVILWLPLGLYALEMFFDRKYFIGLLLFSISITFALFAGHIQLSFLVIVFFTTYALFRYSSTKDKKPLLYASVTLILSLGIASVQLFPMLELITLSARVPQSYDFLVNTLLIQPYQLILFAVPDIFGNPATRNYLINDTYPGNSLYIGIISCVFVFISLTQLKKNIYVKFFSIISLLLLIYMVRTPVSEVFYRFEIPFVSSSSPTNAIFLLSFALSILAGYGMQQWMVQKGKNSLQPVIISLATLALFLIGLFIFQKEFVSIKNILYSLGILFIFLIAYYALRYFPKKAFLLSVCISLFLVADLWYLFQKFNPFVPQELVYPTAPVFQELQKQNSFGRFWGYGNANIESNFATQYRLFSPDGYDPLYPKWYGEFIQASKDGVIEKQFTNRTRSDAFIAQTDSFEDLEKNQYRLKIMDILGVNYLLSREVEAFKNIDSQQFKYLFSDNNWNIYKNVNALQRAFLVDTIQIYTNAQDFQAKLFDKSFDPHKAVLLEQKVELTQDVVSLQQTVTISAYDSTKVSIRTKANKDTMLVLSDVYFPGWKARIDGKEIPIYKANYAFRAVSVPSGNHTIEFSYQPDSFSLGLKTSIISLVLLLGFLLIQKRKYEK